MSPRGACRGMVLVLFLICVVPVAVFAADTASVRDRTRQTLLYGIDSQVLEAIQAIRNLKDTSFTRELAQALDENRSVDVQKAVFDLFKEQKLRDGEERGKTLLAAGLDTQESLLIAAIQYLAAIRSSSLAAGLPPVLDGASNAAALAAIQALGTTGDKSAGTLLVARLTSTDFPDARKNECILALGNLKDPVAEEALIAIAGSTDEEKIRRMYAADSLGRIGDKRALPVLKTMVAENDALIRLYAASALSHFGLDEVFPVLIQGLRDENAKVREQSARALARQLSPSQADTAVPILSYKAEFDPEPIVRAASIEALGAIGRDASLKVLLKVYSGADNRLDSREAALGVLAEKYLSESIETIRAVIAAEWTSFDQRTLESTARLLSSARSPALKEILVRFLDSKNANVRSYGVRGIGGNGFSDLKERVKKMAEQDPNPGTRREAALAYEKL
jgi:HEAT repeat protein